jgi:hypothetical protein
MGARQGFAGGGNSGSSMTDMDVVNRESPQELEQNSEVTSVVTTKKTLTAHKFPSNIDQPAKNDKENPAICEVIHFEVYKKGGISFSRASEESAIKARAENKAANKLAYNNLGVKPIKAVKQSQSAFEADLKIWEEGRAKFAPRAEGDERNVGQAAMDVIQEQLKNMRTPKETIEHCFLYMPASVTYSEGANWASEDLGAVGNAISTGLKNTGGGVSNMLKNFGAGAGAEIAQAAAVGIGAAAAGIVGMLGMGAMLGGIGAGLKSAGRVAQNPYAEQLFNGVDFRSFSFEFVFTATNKEEYGQVRNIIKMFRKNSRPGYLTHDGKDIDALYTFPNEFGIFFKTMRNGSYVKNEHLPKLHDCVCTKVDTNFAPGGQWLAHNDGEPISISLSLGFTETRKNAQREIEAGY